MELKGKIINFLGDSITEGVGLYDEYIDKRFSSLICRECECKRVNNYGVGGSRIAHQKTPSMKARHDLDFCGRCWDMDKEADIIVVFGGVNDYFHGDAPFGNPDDATRETFCGSLNYLCSTINELYPNAAYVFIAPAHTYGDHDYSKDPKKPAFAERHYLSEYAQAIMTIPKKYKFHVWNMAEELGIDPNNPEDYKKYTVDGIHFNEEGHKVLAEKITGFLKSI